MHSALQATKMMENQAGINVVSANFQSADVDQRNDANDSENVDQTGVDVCADFDIAFIC